MTIAWDWRNRGKTDEAGCEWTGSGCSIRALRVLPDFQGLPDLWRTLYRGRGFMLRALAREVRTAATFRAEGAVHARRGDILDLKMFSNPSLNLLVELEETLLLDFPDGDGELVIPPPRVPG